MPLPVVPGQIDVLPSQRREMAQQGLVDGLSAVGECLDRALKITVFHRTMAATTRLSPLARYRWCAKLRSRISPRRLKNTARSKACFARKRGDLHGLRKIGGVTALLGSSHRSAVQCGYVAFEWHYKASTALECCNKFLTNSR